MIADVPQFVITSPLSFFFGLAIGFVLSDRYRITRRDGSTSDTDRPDRRRSE